MLSYLSDLMEDMNGFSWSSAKAAHAVLLFEMERDSLNLNDIDRIRTHCPKIFKQKWSKFGQQK